MNKETINMANCHHDKSDTEIILKILDEKYENDKSTCKISDYQKILKKQKILDSLDTDFVSHKNKIEKYMKKIDMSYKINKNITDIDEDYYTFRKIMNIVDPLNFLIFDLYKFNSMYYQYQMLLELSGTFIKENEKYWQIINGKWIRILETQAYRNAYDIWNKFLKYTSKNTKELELKEFIKKSSDSWDNCKVEYKDCLDSIFSMIEKKNHHFLDLKIVSLKDTPLVNYKQSIGIFLSITINKTYNKNDIIQATELYQRYINFCKLNNFEKTSNTHFGRQISDNNIIIKKTSKCNYYLGINYQDLSLFQ